jgi:dCMP deaminase
MMTDKWDHRYLALARLVASWSKDPSTQVGAVLVSPDNHVISVGYNGFPAGMDDAPERYADRSEKYSRIIHAEMNALLCAPVGLHGSTLYTSLPPCDRCTVMLLQAGVHRFVSAAVPVEAQDRWREAIARSRAFVSECGGEWKVETL